MKKIAISSLSVSEIEALLKSKPDSKTTLRLSNILALAKGDSSRKAAELSPLSHNQICIWAKRFNENGLAGLKDKEKTGRKSRISPTQLLWLKNLVLPESPTAHGFNTETWTAPMLVKMLKSTHHLVYSDEAVYLLLKKKLGLSHKKGQGFYGEANKEKREAFVVALKKKSFPAL
jgi:transposase